MGSKTGQSFIVEKHLLLGGEAEVIRTATSGKIYQFRMWVSKEKTYVRKSLRTNDLHIALELAKKEFYHTIGIIESGKKVKDITVGELCKEFIEDKKVDVSMRYITKDRVSAISSYLKNFILFIGKNTSVGSLHTQSCYDYAEWRKKHSASVKDDTIKNEKVTINSFIKYAKKKKYCDFDKFDFRKTGVSQKHTSRRGAFNDDEYKKIILFLRSWTAKKNNTDDKVRLKRMMIRDMFFAATNTYLRIGELKNLTWKDILGYENIIDNIGHHITLVTLRVRGETSKVRKERVITTRGGNFFRRWYRHTRFKDENDFVFCGDKGSNRLSGDILYESWEEVMNGVGIKYKESNITWYSCRHYGITARLKAGANVFNLAKIAGSSVLQIENFYGHFDQAMSRETSMMNYKSSNKVKTYRDD